MCRRSPSMPNRTRRPEPVPVHHACWETSSSVPWWPGATRRLRGGYEAELGLLVVHGVLHVLGMDHGEPDEAEAMVACERHHLAAAGLERRG